MVSSGLLCYLVTCWSAKGKVKSTSPVMKFSADSDKIIESANV